MRRSTSTVVIAVVLSVAACRSKPPLANTYPSADAVATAVLDALARGDRARLEALALSEQEFQDHVWADLPAAKPERNLPLSYVWGDLRQKSQIALGVTLEDHGGRRYALERVTFAGQTPYAHYLVHRDATFHVRDAGGTAIALRVCGSLIEKDGGWKVFSYVVD